MYHMEYINNKEAIERLKQRLSSIIENISNYFKKLNDVNDAQEKNEKMY